MYKGPNSGAVSRLLVPDPADDHADEPKKCQSWAEIHEEEAICKLLLEQNRATLLGANDTPFGSGPLKDLLGTFGLSPESDQLLDGTLDPAEITTDVVLQAWMRNWQHTEASRNAPPIDLVISRKEWCDIIRHIPESRSSSPSGVHFGHSHAWTRIKSVAFLRSQMDMFPHQHGFAPHRWKQIVDVMLEKIAGRPYSHTLPLWVWCWGWLCRRTHT